MNMSSTLVSVYLVMALAILTGLLQENSCSAESIAGEYNDGGGGVNDNSVEEIEEDLGAQKDHDDELISQLLEAPIGNPDLDSDVSRILKILEAAEQATSTTTTTSSTTTTTTPKPTTTESTTTTESPFFKTERPSKYTPKVEELNDLGAMLSYLDQSFNEAEQELDEGDDEPAKGDNNQTRIERRSGYHEPSINSLLWSTARAMWDVSRPVFYQTKVGRKVNLVSDTLTLPLRTFGAIRHKIHDLTHNPHGYDRKHRNARWGVFSNDHHHHHGWGWDSDVTFVKYEPENSLFKSWVRYLFRAIKPVIISKIRLKRQLIRIKLRFVGSLIRLFQSVKIQKVFSILRALTTKLQILKSRIRPNVVVLKEAGTTKAPVHHGWGWKEHHGWHGWPQEQHGWPSPPPPPPKPSYGPPPKSSYGPPQYEPHAPVPSYSQQDTVYGPPAEGNYGKSSWGSSPRQSYGPPEATKDRPSPVAYNAGNTYTNYRASPNQWLTAPELLAQASEDHEQSSSSTSSKEIETPSYAKFLKQFGINPHNLADDFPGVVLESSSKESSGRNLRQSNNGEKSSSKNIEDVPYIVPSETPTEEATANVDKDSSATPPPSASRRFA